MDKEQNTNYLIKGDNVSFAFLQKQTGIFTPPGEAIVLQPTTINLNNNELSGIFAYGYTVGNESFVLGSAVLVESHTQPTNTGNYIEKSYIISTTDFNFQSNLFSGATSTFTSGDLNAAQILVHCLNTFSVATTSLTVRINFSGSEEEKVILTGIIENTLKNTPLENKKNLNWEWFDV